VSVRTDKRKGDGVHDAFLSGHAAALQFSDLRR
jgi:hypothetical protein